MSAQKQDDIVSRATTATGSRHSDTPSVKLHNYKAMILKHVFTFISLLGIFLGLALGFTFKYSPLFGSDYWNPRRLSYVKLPGELFLNMLQCMYAPILLSSIMAAIGSLEMKAFKFSMWRVFVYMSVSTLAASALGTIVVMFIHPGIPNHHPRHPACFEPPTPKLNATAPAASATYRESHCTKDGHPCFIHKYDKHFWGKQNELKLTKPPTGNDIRYCSDAFVLASCEIVEDGLMDTIRAFFPRNIFQAFILSTRIRPDLASPTDPNAPKFTGVEPCTEYVLSSSTTSIPSLEEYYIEPVYVKAFNLDGTLTFFIFAVIAALAIHESGLPALNLVTSLSQCTLKMCTWIIWLSPIAVTSLLAGSILEETSLFAFPATILYFVITCVIGLLIYTLVALPLAYYAFLRQPPFQFYRKLLPILVLKLGTSSEACTFPITIEFLETVCHLDSKIVRLMIPLASQINSDGTAICTAVAVGYIAQLHGIKLDFKAFGNIIFYTFMAVSTTPMGDSRSHNGLFYRRMLIALISVTLPVGFRVYVESINWVIDRLAVVTNTLSDCVGCAIIDHCALQRIEEQKHGHVFVTPSSKHMESSKMNSQQTIINSKPVSVFTTSVMSDAEINEPVNVSAMSASAPKNKNVQKLSKLSYPIIMSLKKPQIESSRPSSLDKVGSPSNFSRSKSKDISTATSLDRDLGKKIGKMSSFKSNRSATTPTSSRKSPKSSQEKMSSINTKSKTRRRIRKSKSKLSETFAPSKSPKRSRSKSKAKSKSSTKSKSTKTSTQLD